MMVMEMKYNYDRNSVTWPGLLKSIWFDCFYNDGKLSKTLLIKRLRNPQYRKCFIMNGKSWK